MIGIDILEKEHENILNFIDDFEEYFVDVIDGQQIDISYLRRAIDFIREYADAHHHQKEENYLFVKMLDLGKTAESLIRTGMLVEHDLARYTVGELEEALNSYEKDPTSKSKLDIISHSMNYVYLLRRHISKENDVLYPFAVNHLDDEAKDWINEKSIQMDELHKDSIEDKFKDLLR